MSFPKIVILSLIFVSFQPAWAFPSYLQIGYASPSIAMSDARLSAEDPALNAMVDSFKLYYSFFNDCDYQQGYQLPRHGINRKTAIEYLSAGFETELATAIVDEYTWIMPELDCLAIKPGDGLPIINEEDLSHLTCSRINDSKIVFSREFTGCYSPHDRYIYQVEMRLYEDQWKISALSLDQQ